MLKTSSITNLNVEFEYLTVDFELNLNRSRLGLDLRAYKYRHLTFWVGILRNFNSFLFKENIKWQEYFYALYKTNIDCSIIGKLCKITPLVDWRPWAYISLDFVSGNIVAHGLQSPRGVILHNFPHEQSIFVYYSLKQSIVIVIAFELLMAFSDKVEQV